MLYFRGRLFLYQGKESAVKINKNIKDYAINKFNVNLKLKNKIYLCFISVR